MKIACTHFQCAAWGFDQLYKHFPEFYADYESDLLEWMSELMLVSRIYSFFFIHSITIFFSKSQAQAQECILEKSMLDNRKALINAKIAAQVALFYHQLHSSITSKPAVKDWLECDFYVHTFKVLSRKSQEI